jgi:hypothetical protein
MSGNSGKSNLPILFRLAQIAVSLRDNYAPDFSLFPSKVYLPVIGIGKGEPALHNVIHGLTVLLKISLSHVSGFGFVSAFDNEDLKLLAGENVIRQFFLTKNQKFVQFETAENMEENSDFQRNIEMI